MKVIWKPDKSILQNCLNCGSILEVTKEDTQESEFHFDHIFICPVCKASSAISGLSMLLLDSLIERKEN